MKYPNEFTMQAMTDANISYTFTYDVIAGKFVTKYNGQYFHYTQEQLMEWKDYVMVPKGSCNGSCNGVDGEGNPFHFTQDMLKPFMRVVDKAGRVWMATGVCYDDGKPALVAMSPINSHITFCNTVEECSGWEDYIAMEVFDAPEFYDFMNPDIFGDLVWQRVEQSANVGKLSKEFQQRLDYFETHISAVQENLDNLKESFERLKQEAK